MTLVIIIILLAAAASAAPIVATVLVTIASRREDRQWSLSQQTPDLTAMLARRIVDFRSETPLPRPKSRPYSSRQHAALAARTTAAVAGPAVASEPRVLANAKMN